VIGALPPSSWQEQKIVLDELKARVRSGFQSLEQRLAEELLKSLPTQVPSDLVLPHVFAPRSTPLPPQPAQIATEPADPHGHTQQLLVEIGRLQRFIAESEFPLETRRLDVVWRRVQRSVPSYVFEVQVAGNLTEAMAKLKQAFETWNSNIFLVGNEDHRGAVNQLLAQLPQFGE
jgi:hypothetical protein